MSPTERFHFPQSTQETLEHLPVPFAVYQYLDKQVVPLVLSGGFCRLFGYEDRALAYREMERNMYQDTHPDDAARIANAALRFATEGGIYEVIYRSRPGNGSAYRMIHAYGEHVYTDTGVRLAYVWYSDEGPYLEHPDQQGSELNQSLCNALHENSLLKASRYDDLTGLPGMTYFFELAEEGKAAAQREGTASALLFLDFRGMKFFNTKYGFAEGDVLLRSFARVLARIFGNERCCRIGDDHFAVYAQQAGLQAQLEQLLRDCREMNGGRTLPVHVGVYVGQNEGVHISTACDRAKLACDTLSGRYESAVQYYSNILGEEADSRQYIIENIDRAIAERWIQVYLQPIVRSVNGQVCDMEALARWFDPVKGMLSPASFIPVLEDAGLIYKLDLYMLDRVLETIQQQMAAGLCVVPHSINLSRSDFDVMDMVEEIRRRVDHAGIPRDRITIELTESVIGQAQDFMKEQVQRFQRLGFPVWMDDFGSGYSSLDILQSIKFNLLKFDMSFMRRLNEGDQAKLLLTELMKMANSLGLDNVCEGVETEEQVRFLQEIGCSKLQGYYFSKPVPAASILQDRTAEGLMEWENPAEAKYYDRIGRVNLYDLGVIAGDEKSAFHHVFNTLPIAILEVREGHARYVRSNRSYQDFVRQLFGVDILKDSIDRDGGILPYDSSFRAVVRQCCEQGTTAFFDDKMPDGSVAHSFLRRIHQNPVTGSVSIAVAVLFVQEPDESETYADIARALAADYYNLFVIDLDTEEFTEYASQVGGEELSVVRHGEDFFVSARRDTLERVYEEDQETFLYLFTKERVLSDLDKQGVFTTSYRLMDTGSPMYVNMKITRLHGGNRLIMGISVIDAHMKQLEAEKALRQEKASLGRIAALSPDYLVLYTVDPETGHYTQYSPSNGFEKIGLARQGEDFFADVVLDAPKAIAPEDLERHLRTLTRENMLRDIQSKGFFVHHYHLIMEGEEIPACLRATMVDEEDGQKLILGVTNEAEEYRREWEDAQRLSRVNQTITDLLDNMPGMTFTKDAKTGVYLACNQAFASYAHKSTPGGVTGCTDAELFDPETARHFVQDDQIALSMDKPYIFFEDVPDAVGNQRQFQTTKLKYTDAFGRLCLQGMCQDVTDMVRIQRENADTKEAYQKASTQAAIYSHLAHALARGCTELYYVNMETDAFIEFHTDSVSGVLTEARRGTDFFEGCERDAKRLIHPEDQGVFLGAMNRQFLSEHLIGDQVYELTYRRLRDQSPFYVEMKVTRMEDDPRYIVLAVSDIDELMQKRRDEARIKEERLIYARLHALTGNFLCVYVVDPETGSYREFSATTDYVDSFARAKEGQDFFSSVRRDAAAFGYPADLKGFLAAFTRENVLSEVKRSGIFTWDYRIMMEGKPRYVQMKAAMVEEKEGKRLIVGLNDVDAQYRQREVDREIARQKEIYNQITASLTEQYDTLYYIDTKTNTYTEISATDDYKKLNVPATGNDFFAESRRSIRKYVHPEDQEKVLSIHYKDVMLNNLKNTRSFSMSWRLVVNGQVKHIRHTELLARDGAHIIVCIKNIDAEVQAMLHMEADKLKSVTYTQIAERLASHFDLIYYIDCATSKYAEFSTKKKSGELKIQSEGEDFFAASAQNIDRLIYSSDKERIRLFLDRDHLISQLENRRQLIEDYRMVLDNGKTQYARMSVTYSSDHAHFIICVENREEDVRREKEHLAALSMANEMARRDELTHTRNKTAYREMERELQKQIEEGGAPFGIVVCDINGLKIINDTQGHKAGDAYIRASCKLICTIFHHSPVFRIGGDEFVTILRGKDYQNRKSLITSLKKQVAENARMGEGPVVATGLAEYQPGADRSVEDVFNKADKEMYLDKARLKEEKRHLETLSFQNTGAFKIITDERRIKVDALYKAFEAVAEGSYVYLCDMQYDFSRWSKSAVDTFGLPSEYMYGAGDIWENQIHPEDRKEYHQGIDEIFSGESACHDMHYRARCITGEYVPCTCRGVVIRNSSGEPDFFAGAIQNHSVQSRTDELTGMQNQYGFLEDLDSYRKRQTSISVILFSIRKFSKINETYGYLFGNRVLQLFARSVIARMGQAGHTYRVDGASFAVISNTLSLSELREAYQQFRSFLHEGFQVDGRALVLNLYCGALRVERFDLDSQRVYACLNRARETSKLHHQGDFVEYREDRV